MIRRPEPKRRPPAAGPPSFPRGQTLAPYEPPPPKPRILPREYIATIVSAGEPYWLGRYSRWEIQLHGRIEAPDYPELPLNCALAGGRNEQPRAAHSGKLLACWTATMGRKPRAGEVPDPQAMVGKRVRVKVRDAESSIYGVYSVIEDILGAA